MKRIPAKYLVLLRSYLDFNNKNKKKDRKSGLEILVEA